HRIRTATLIPLLNLVLISISIPTLGSSGPLAACLCTTGSYLLSGVLALMVAEPAMGVGDLVRSLGPPAAACVPLALVALAAKWECQRLGLAPAWSLAAQVLAGGACFVAAALVFAPALSRDFLNLVTSVLRRRAAASARENNEPPSDHREVG